MTARRLPALRLSALRRWLHPLHRRLETAVHPLRYLFLEITQRCNLRCRHCGSDCGSEPRAGELDTEEWLACFDYLAARCRRDRVALVLTGGEPLCHPDLGALLARLHDRGLTWGMVTNGQLLTERNVRSLLEYGVNAVTVSLDGVGDSHDWLRGSPGAFARARDGIARLASAPPLHFDVVTCVHPKNLGELPAIHALLAELGVPAWRLFPIFPRGRAAADPELRLDATGYRRLLDFLRAARARGGPVRAALSCEGYLPPALDAEVRDEPYFCRAGIDIASVLSDGAIGACPNLSRGLVQGNVRDDDLLDVWEYRFAPFRERGWMRTGDCVPCREWRRCQGNSLHLWDDARGRTAFCSFTAATGTAPRAHEPPPRG